MSEAELNTYKLQLQQVEAALTTDPDNTELQTLKQDLEQVINLTQDLIQAQLKQSEQGGDDSNEASSSSSAKHSSKPVTNLTPVKHWQVGEACQAVWSKDGQYYEAHIEEITTDGEVSVRFLQYPQNTEVTSLGLLRMSSYGFSGTSSLANKKEKLAKQREYLKKKKAKKVERFKQLEKEREDEKSKWQSFSNKAFGKRGFVKKSIFKTPENPQGRVGIGTCGVSGQEMTKYSAAQKYRKGL